MVGLWNMESKRPVCAYCKIQSVTDCDKTGAPICSKHSAIVPNGAEVIVYARKHAPRSHKNGIRRQKRFTRTQLIMVFGKMKKMMVKEWH